MQPISHAAVCQALLALSPGGSLPLFGRPVRRISSRTWSVDLSYPLSLLVAVDRVMRHHTPVKGGIPDVDLAAPAAAALPALADPPPSYPGTRARAAATVPAAAAARSVPQLRKPYARSR